MIWFVYELLPSIIFNCAFIPPQFTSYITYQSPHIYTSQLAELEKVYFNESCVTLQQIICTIDSHTQLDHHLMDNCVSISHTPWLFKHRFYGHFKIRAIYVGLRKPQFARFLFVFIFLSWRAKTLNATNCVYLFLLWAIWPPHPWIGLNYFPLYPSIPHQSPLNINTSWSQWRMQGRPPTRWSLSIT